MGRKRGALWYIGLIAVIFIAAPLAVMAVNYSLQFYGFKPISLFPSQEEKTTTTTAPSYTLKLPIQVQDELSGSAISGATVYIYTDPKATAAEVLTTDTAGSATTGSPYKSGTQLWVLVKNGNSYYGTWLTVPMGERETQTTHITQTIKLRTLMTGSLTVRDPSGATISNGGTYNVTVAGNTKPVFTVELRNSADNTGFKSFSDARYGRDWKLVTYFLIQNTGSQTGAQYVVITNQPIVSQLSASDKRYGVEIPDDAVKRIKDSTGNYISLGTWAGTIQVDASSLPVGSACTITIVSVAYTSTQYYSQYSGYGPIATQLATMSFNVAA